MSVPEIKGYCPGALRPMMSGDGLVVRVRPFLGRLDPAQAKGIAALAAVHGNGTIDLSSRANLQIRGVTEHSYPALIEGLRALSLLDEDLTVESRRNVLLTPFWAMGTSTEMLATALTEALSSADAPNLPGKFGFAVDTGVKPVLQDASADVRIERDAEGGLLLLPDGAVVGKPVAPQQVVKQAIKLAQWFMDQRQDQSRMAALLNAGAVLPSGFSVPRQPSANPPVPAVREDGTLVGLAFGQMSAATLDFLADHGALRLTPWRMILVEGAWTLPLRDDLITTPDDPLLRVIACTGAPGCAQALAATRPLARQLAPSVPQGQRLHVSGCAKGCAYPKPAALTVVATTSGFSLIKAGRPGDMPFQTVHSPEDIQKAF